MDVYMVVLRLIHIVAGVLWAGWSFSLVLFVEPAARIAGPEGGKFMQTMAGKTRIVQILAAAPGLVILSGVLMYYRVSGGLNPGWVTSGPGLALTIGALAAIAAFISGMVINRPAAQRMAVLSREMQSAGGPPSPAQLAELRAQQERLSQGGLYAAILLLIAVIGMSIAEYL